MKIPPVVADEPVEAFVPPLPVLSFTAADLLTRDTVAAALGRRLLAGAGEVEATATLVAALCATPAAGRR